MLLTDIIQDSTSAIKKHRAMIESKQSADAYTKALAQLEKATSSMKRTLDCAAAMKESGIFSTPLLDENTRSELLDCIDDCGNGISELSLTQSTVKLLQSKGDALAAQLNIVWSEAAGTYSGASKGYLSMIGSLSNNPRRARELTDSISSAVAGKPSIKSINGLVADVKEAQEFVEAFSLNPKIESFLKKVSSQQATVADLTPDVTAWLKEKKLMGKLKITF